jgi:hypothetical protein
VADPDDVSGEKPVHRWEFISDVIDLTLMRRGEPYVGLTSEQHAFGIGAVLLMWNAYENAFGKLYRGFYRYLEVEPSQRERSYPKQVEALAQHIDAVFDDTMHFKAVLQDTFNRSRSPHRKRNALAHGRYTWTARAEEPEPGKIEMVPVVHVEARGGPIQLSVSDLTGLRYELANLAGRLQALTSGSLHDDWLCSVLPPNEMHLLQFVFAQQGSDGA